MSVKTLKFYDEILGLKILTDNEDLAQDARLAALETLAAGLPPDGARAMGAAVWRRTLAERRGAHVVLLGGDGLPDAAQDLDPETALLAREELEAREREIAADPSLRALADGELRLEDLPVGQRRRQQLLAEALRSPAAARALLQRLVAALAQREAEQRQLELELELA